MNWYIETLYNIIVRPQDFFSNMPKGAWSEDSLSFALVTGWILSTCLTLMVFISSYVPTGLTLIEGIHGKKLIIAFPVLAVMGVAFFLMTLFIVAGILCLAILGFFSACAAGLNFLLILLGGKGNIYEVGKAALYSSGASVALCLNIFAMILVKYKMLSNPVWMLLENAVVYLMCLYFFWTFSIIGEKTHGLPKWRAVLAAAVPFVIFVLVNIVFSKKFLPKIIK